MGVGGLEQADGSVGRLERGAVHAAHPPRAKVEEGLTASFRGKCRSARELRESARLQVRGCRPLFRDLLPLLRPANTEEWGACDDSCGRAWAFSQTPMMQVGTLTN